MPIPYPKREFLTDDEEDKGASGAASKVSMATIYCEIRIVTGGLNVVPVTHRLLCNLV